MGDNRGIGNRLLNWPKLLGLYDFSSIVVPE